MAWAVLLLMLVLVLPAPGHAQITWQVTNVYSSSSLVLMPPQGLSLNQGGVRYVVPAAVLQQNIYEQPGVLISADGQQWSFVGVGAPDVTQGAVFASLVEGLAQIGNSNALLFRSIPDPVLYLSRDGGHTWQSTGRRFPRCNTNGPFSTPQGAVIVCTDPFSRSIDVYTTTDGYSWAGPQRLQWVSGQFGYVTFSVVSPLPGLGIGVEYGSYRYQGWRVLAPVNKLILFPGWNSYATPALPAITLEVALPLSFQIAGRNAVGGIQLLIAGNDPYGQTGKIALSSDGGQTWSVQATQTAGLVAAFWDPMDQVWLVVDAYGALLANPDPFANPTNWTPVQDTTGQPVKMPMMGTTPPNALVILNAILLDPYAVFWDRQGTGGVLARAQKPQTGGTGGGAGGGGAGSGGGTGTSGGTGGGAGGAGAGNGASPIAYPPGGGSAGGCATPSGATFMVGLLLLTWMALLAHAMPASGRVLQKRLPFWLLAFVILAATSWAQEPWRFSGYDLLRVERYGIQGPRQQAPFDTPGWHYFDELGLRGNHEGEQSRAALEASGLLYTHSRYRSRYIGIVPERLYALYESWAGTPYRLEAGDLFGFFTTRTLQASLIGTSAEVQHDLGDWQSSVLVLGGATAGDWHALRWSQGHGEGVSWALAHDVWGTIALNWVAHQRTAAGAKSSQNDISAAWGWEYPMEEHALSVELEAARLSGDPAQLPAGAAPTNGGTGLFAEVAWEPMAQGLGLRVRGESYDPGYAPALAPIQPARRTLETFATWRFAEGELEARILGYQDGWKTANLNTQTVAGLRGSWNLGGWSGTADGSLTRWKRAGNRGRDSVIQASLTGPLAPAWSLRAQGFWRLSNVVQGLGLDQQVREVQLFAEYTGPLGGWDAFMAPGVIWRSTIQYQRNSAHIEPLFRARLQRNPHQWGLELGTLRERYPQGVIYRRHAALRYTYTAPWGETGLEADYAGFSSSAPPAPATSAYRIAWFVRYDFAWEMGRKAAENKPAPETPAAPAETEDIAAHLRLGMDTKEFLAWMRVHGWGEPASEQGWLRWHARVFPEVPFAQELLVRTDAGRVVEAAVFIAPLKVWSDARALVRALDRILEHLNARWGRPERRHELGDVRVGNLAEAVFRGAWVRNYEWRREDGVVRLGVPKRLDRRVLIQLRYARTLPPILSNTWGLEVQP